MEEERDDELICWKTLEAAANDLGTPLYVYLPQMAQLAYERLCQGAEHWGAFRIAYSLKTNPLHALLTDLCELGSFIEVVSEWELKIAQQAGFAKNRIVFNGPLKPNDALEVAATLNLLTINIDSLEELYYLNECVSIRSESPIGIGVRICPPRENRAWSRFGLLFDTGEVEEAVRMIRNHPGMRLACIHLHLGTQITQLDRYTHLVLFAQQVWQRLRLGPEVWLDIGGGFPYLHNKPLSAQPFQPEPFFASLRDKWHLEVRPPLILEPGRCIAAPALVLVASTISRKERIGEPSIIVLDSGTNHNVMGAFYEHLWEFQAVEDSETLFRICGPLCMEDDILSGAVHRHAPVTGSLVAMRNAGAYSFALSRTFIQPRPAVVRFNKTNRYDKLVSRESACDVYGQMPCEQRYCQVMGGLEMAPMASAELTESERLGL